MHRNRAKWPLLCGNPPKSFPSRMKDRKNQECPLPTSFSSTLEIGGGHPSVALSYPSNYLTEQPTHEQIMRDKKKIKTTKVPGELVKLSSREFVITFSENIRP